MDYNVVVTNSCWTERDIEIIFDGEDVLYTDTTELASLCKELGIYPSTSAARKAGRVGNIPTGYSEIKASKKHFLYVWNPDEY